MSATVLDTLPDIVDPLAWIRKNFGQDKRYAYFPNSGNLGDVLIAGATIIGLQKQQLNWSFFDYGQEHRHVDVFIYGGGGNLIPSYRSASHFLEKVAPYGKPIVILPHSVRGNEDLLARLRNTTIFCRDIPSFRHVSRFQNINAMLSHDMALSFDLTWYGLWVARNWARLHANSANVLYAFRSDGESAGGLAPPAGERNIDVSVVGEGVFNGTASIIAQCASFLTAIGGYGRVCTDRLHVAIAAALLDKEVELHDNSYGKCAAVHELSLRHRFPKVRLVPSLLTAPADPGASAP